MQLCVFEHQSTIGRILDALLDDENHRDTYLYELRQKSKPFLLQTLRPIAASGEGSERIYTLSAQFPEFERGDYTVRLGDIKDVAMFPDDVPEIAFLPSAKTRTPQLVTAAL